jgi:hypothetical protein
MCVSTAKPPYRSAGGVPVQVEIKVSTYDHVASWIVSLLVVVGVCVLALLAVWLSKHISFSHMTAPVEIVEYSGYGGRGDHAAGFGRDAELGEPGMEPGEGGGETAEPSMESMMTAVTDVVSSQAAAVDAMVAPVASSAALAGGGEGAGGNPVGGGTGVGWGKGKGIGDSRKPGPLGEGPEGVLPPWERWEVRFSTAGIDLYARQLDFFKIELAAIGGGRPQVDYACNVSKPKPDHRLGKPDEEKRIYMTWRDARSPIAVFDRQLLQRAGVATDRRLVLQFIPEDTERQLGLLEAQNAKGRNPLEFYRTVFGVREARGRFEFFVIEQRFRAAPRI